MKKDTTLNFFMGLAAIPLLPFIILCGLGYVFFLMTTAVGEDLRDQLKGIFNEASNKD